MEHILAVNVTSISVTPLQCMEMITVVRMVGDNEEPFERLPLVDAKGSSKITNSNEDINDFLVEQRSLKLGTLNFIVEIWAKEFLDEKTSKDKKIGDEKTGGEKKAGDLLSPREELPGSKKVGDVLIPMEELLSNKAGGNGHSGSYVLRRASGEAKVMLSLGSSKIPNCNEDINYFLVDQRSLKLGTLNFIVEIWAKEFLDEKTSKDKKIGDEKTGGEKKAGDLLSPREELPGSKKVGDVLIPMEELLRNKADGNEHSGSYVLRRASGEAKVMLSLSVKIVDVTMPNDSDSAADGATYSACRYTPSQPYTGYIPAPGHYQTYPSNPYSAPSNQFVPPVSNAYYYYNQGYPSDYFYNPHIQGYPPFHGYSHAPQQPTSTLGWVCTGLNIVHDFLLLAELLGEPIMDGFGGGEFGGA